MEERRRVQRTQVLKGAKIILNGRSSMFDCTVRNLTNFGACLHLASPLGTPGTFDLTFDSARSSRLCRVIWRSQNKLGVAFA
jgi:PilZ domain